MCFVGRSFSGKDRRFRCAESRSQDCLKAKFSFCHFAMRNQQKMRL
jgi:hypothetical protein